MERIEKRDLNGLEPRKGEHVPCKSSVDSEGVSCTQKTPLLIMPFLADEACMHGTRIVLSITCLLSAPCIH